MSSKLMAWRRALSGWRIVTDPALAQRSAVASAGSFLGTFAILLAAIALLFAIDTLLVEKEQAARRSEARPSLSGGIEAPATGKASDEDRKRLRGAVSDERDNSAYQGQARWPRPNWRRAQDCRCANRIPTVSSAIHRRGGRLPRPSWPGRSCEHRPTLAISFYHRAIPASGRTTS